MTRLLWLMASCYSVAAATWPALITSPPKLIWNASASVPEGLYAVRSASAFDITDLVAVMPPEPIAVFLADRGYLPRGVPMMKHILALPGQTVCREKRRITIDRVDVGEAQIHDSRGRDLPAWEGCRTLRLGEVFLMNPGVPDSFDGRYFGPLPANSIIGRAIPLWTDEEGDGRFVWRAATR
ncbi:MAG: S26 family signal peptidase [Methylovirgula sp.]